MNPKVTVVCITYNHEKYLEQALDSFLAQQTDFEYQVFVGDDCSCDSTPDIIRRYASLYPNVIVPFIRSSNMGAQRNLIDMCQRATSPYIAFCEGDDYWIDSKKLQKQYDLMESNQRFAACFHDAFISIETDDGRWFLSKDYSHASDGKLRWSTGHKDFIVKDTYSIEDYIPCGFVHTSSMFFRWNYNLVIPVWYYDHIVGDYSIWTLQVGEGIFGFVNETMSVHRRHSDSSYHYDDRMEFWKRTKADWINLDQDFIDYFTAKGARSTIVDAFKMRQLNDASKMLRGYFVTDNRRSISQCISQHETIIRQCFDIPRSDRCTVSVVRHKLNLGWQYQYLPLSVKRLLRELKHGAR